MNDTDNNDIRFKAKPNDTYSDGDPRSDNYIRVLVRPALKYHLGLIYILSILLIAVTILYITSLFALPTWLIILCIILALLLFALFTSKFLAIGLIHIYQRFAPAQIRGRCMYEPSCSEYMIQAIRKYGFLSGIKRGIKRLKRCKPHLGGFDPP